MRCAFFSILLSALVALPVYAQSDEDVAEVPVETSIIPLEKPGYFGLGLGIQMPMVGVVTGFGAMSNPGAGYNLGFAITWEFIPRYELRLYAGGGQTYGASAALDYRENGELTAGSRTENQDAQWIGLDLGVGITYLFREAGRAWTPFVGIDGGFSFQGYYYSLKPEVGLKLTQVGDNAPVYAFGETEGIGQSWHLSSRGGVRLDFLKWFSSSLEFVVTVSPISENEPITNTYPGRQVSAPADMLVLTRLVFSIWLGL